MNDTPHKKWRIALLTLATAASGALSAGTEWHAHEDIRSAAEQYVQQQLSGSSNVRARAAGVDNRLRLRRCDDELEAFLPSGRSLDGSNTTIGIRCPGPVQWRIFVQVQTEILMPVVVTQVALQRGEIIGPEHVSMQTRDTGALRRDYYRSVDEVIGMRLRRQLSPGNVIQPNHLEVRRLVERGQRLQLLSAGQSVQVSMAGEALQHGAKGQRIRVKNLSSGRELEGIVTGSGTVEIRY